MDINEEDDEESEGGTQGEEAAHSARLSNMEAGLLSRIVPEDCAIFYQFCS
jgi:hypothetical protein